MTTVRSRHSYPASFALRLAVFARDGFSCGMCSRKAPEVVLFLARRLRGDGTTSDSFYTVCEDCGSAQRRDEWKGEIREIDRLKQLEEAHTDACWWAELTFYDAPSKIKALMWEIAARAVVEGTWLSIRVNHEKDVLLRGLVAVGAIRVIEFHCSGEIDKEILVLTESERASVDDPGWRFGLTTVGPIRHAPSVAEVHG